jgi:cation diffusion facilitator CzcD-associated flavoprotein CzcO
MAARVDRIRRVGESESTMYTYYPVLIVGAGESGIAMGARLRADLACDQFRIFERKSAIGGTWHSNRYPGIACDVPAIMYSFSWAQKSKWTAPFPSGKEVSRYLYDVCADFRILDKIQLNTSVKSCKWVDEDSEWEVVLDYLAPGVGDMSSNERTSYEKSHGAHSAVLSSETVRAKVVVSAVGGLVEPKTLPKIPGIDSFQGEITHTARWDPNLSVKDKHVVVVGTGCSGAQVVPQLIKPEYGAASVTQLLRSPSWVVPTLPQGLQDFLTQRLPVLGTYIPGFQNSFRKLAFAMSEVEFLALFSPTEAARSRRSAKGQELLEYMRKNTPKQYHDILTPHDEVFCKRRVIDAGWFDSLSHANVEITSQPLTRIDEKSITLGPGRYHPPMSQDSSAPTEERTIPADVIIMANGYQTNTWLHPLKVIGRDNHSLADVWKARGGAQGYLGMAMDGFPNFFMIFGPNTATGHSSVILASENMVNYSIKFIKHILNGEVTEWEVTEKAEREWTAEIQRLLKKGVFASGCSNWYMQENGWNSTAYP